MDPEEIYNTLRKIETLEKIASAGKEIEDRVSIEYNHLLESLQNLPFSDILGYHRYMVEEIQEKTDQIGILCEKLDKAKIQYGN